MQPTPERSTTVRYLVVFATAMAAIFMYVDRACLAQVKGDVQTDLALTDAQMDWIFSAFFWSYALAQVPAGFLGPSLGLRRTMTILLFSWSLCTAVCGLTTGFFALFAARLAVGISEAGAYPTAAAIVKNWFPLTARGRANSMVALGGRVGWAVSQLATPFIVGHVYGWRGMLIVYGVLGIAWAFVFWWLVRDTAKQHPWANDAEVAYAGPTPPPAVPGEWPLAAMARSRNLWLSGVTQFGVNVGWAFLITKLPAMLQERFHATKEASGIIATLPPVASIVGMFLGGFFGDYCIRHYGPRWGRSLPIGSMLCIAGFAYLSCPFLSNPWLVAVALALMAISVDLGVPSLWAFAQDIGGRYTGAALGWGNMFGNLGAAVSPIALGAIQREFGWNAMFLTCSGCFFVAAGAALCLNATVPVMRVAPTQAEPDRHDAEH
jgi:ACS family glucarate transporter-like MFS transporter